MRALVPTLLAAAVLASSPSAVAGQSDPGGRDAYLRAVGEHFGVPSAEVMILSEWELPAAEIPVVLFVSRRGGIAPDAVVALRRAGRPWADVGSRYGVHAGLLHVDVGDAADLGALARIYGEYRSRPSSGWPTIRVEDVEMVHLVNLRVLTDVLDLPPARVLAALVSGGSGPDAYRLLVRGR